MRTIPFLFLASLAAGCGGSTTSDPGGSPHDVVVTPDPGTEAVTDLAAEAPADPGTPDLPPADPGPDLADPGTLPDPGPDLPDLFEPEPDTGTPPSCETASVKGVACAPNQMTYVSFAVVTLDVSGPCTQGKNVHLETTADAQGYYEFPGVPPGTGVLAFSKGSFEGSTNVEIVAGQVADFSGAASRCLAPAAAKLAVVQGSADQIEGLLDELGLDHDTFADGTWDTVESSAAFDLLTHPAKMLEYDVIFIDCSLTVQPMLEAEPAIADNLKKFVDAGKSLYASDWAWAYIEWSWPEAVKYYGVEKSFTKGSGKPDAKVGPRQGPGPTLEEKKNGEPALQIPTDIVDTGLADALKVAKTTLFFDLGTWVVVDSPGTWTTVHLKGKIASKTGASWGERPLAVSFKPGNGKGHVIYTTFHNIAQKDAGASVADIKAILSYLVFSL
jgi:hypothetical protein